MNRAAVGVGSNIDPERHVAEARRRIAERHRLVAESGFVKTEPIGYADQADFLNGVFLVETEMTLADFEAWLHGLEEDLGRVRTENRHGPRTIDLDVVAWNDRVIDLDVFERDFLRMQLSEVLPHLTL